MKKSIQLLSAALLLASGTVFAAPDATGAKITRAITAGNVGISFAGTAFDGVTITRPSTINIHDNNKALSEILAREAKGAPGIPVASFTISRESAGRVLNCTVMFLKNAHAKGLVAAEIPGGCLKDYNISMGYRDSLSKDPSTGVISDELSGSIKVTLDKISNTSK